MFAKFMDEKEAKSKQKKEYKQLNSSNGSINLDEIIPKPSVAVTSNLKKLHLALKEGIYQKYLILLLLFYFRPLIQSGPAN